MADMVSILNTILANGSNEYQSRIPEATRNNLAAVGEAIMSYTPVQNEFIASLVNKIAFQIIRNRTFTNPLAVLKKGGVPLGSDIEDIFTNMAAGQNYDNTGATLLARSIPDTKTMYYRMGRQSKYKATISRQDLQTAFTSFDNLEKLLSSVITSLYSGDNRDEFVLIKNLFAGAITDSCLTTAEAAKVVDESTGKNLVKQIKLASENFQFPSSSFNKYLAKKGSGTAVETWCPKENQILILRSDIKVNIDVDVLAAAFNMDKVEFMGRTLTVDNFGSASKCQAILLDEAVPQVYDNLYETTQFYNPEGLYTNNMLHHWQTYGFSLFGDAIAFMEPAD